MTAEELELRLAEIYAGEDESAAGDGRNGLINSRFEQLYRAQWDNQS